MIRPVHVLIALAIIAAAWFGRYSIEPAYPKSGVSFFVLDRWTGRVLLCSGLECMQLFPPPQIGD